jgi:tetratricopeptide (TPR) repeat protein
MRVLVLAVVLIASPALADKFEKDDLPGPQGEVAKGEPKVDVPALPAFDLPAPEPGFHGPRELRVHGRRVLGTEVKVKGYVTWIYDCAAELAMINPAATRAQILQSIDNNPLLCEPAKFYLGDTRDTARESSTWVVDVPRAPTRTERQKQSRAAPAVPKIAVGDYVTVTGTWGTESLHGEHNADGFVLFKALEPAEPAAAAAALVPANTSKELDVAVATAPPLRKMIDEDVRNGSVDHLNACNKAIVAKQYDAAIAECKAATKMWDGNHLAWYAWASAHMAKSEWPEAKVAGERAVALRPDQAMYQLYYGISLYEAERVRVRDEQARREHKKPDDVTIDPAMMKLDAARDALLRAAKLAPDLWRAHYYLGRVYRDLDDPRRAAQQLSLTITTHPTYRFGYAALFDLYRRWDYADQALAVALLGTTNVAAAEAAELWVDAGLAYEAKHNDDDAIDAFTRAIAGNPDDLNAKFRRGQAYFRKGILASAKRDLEEVARSSDPKVATVKPLASQLLAQITHRKR